MKCTTVLASLAVIAALAFPASGAEVAAPKRRALTWADVEPAAASCFTLVDDGQGGTYASPEGGAASPAVRALGRKTGKAILDACTEASQHFGLAFGSAGHEATVLARDQGREAGTAALRRSLLADPRVARLLRKVMALALTEAGVPCPDCAPGTVALRRVAFADFMPYLVRLCFVSFDDVPATAGEHAHFHVCNGTNDLKGLGPLDPDLSEVALGALYALASEEKTSAALKRIVGPQATVACGAVTGTPSREDIAAINARLRARLALDSDYAALLSSALAHEAAFADLDCGDCLL